MRGGWVWVAAVGCADPGPRSGGGATVEPDPLPKPDGEAILREVIVTPGLVSTQLEIAPHLSRASTVAARCVSADDAGDVYFAETETPSASPVLRLSGMVPRTVYGCAVVVVAPTVDEAPLTFLHETGAAPEDLRPLTVDIDPEIGMQGAWTLAPYGLDAFTGQGWLVIWGPDGRPRWWWALPIGVQLTVEARYDVDRDDLVWGGGLSPEGRVRVVDLWEGETYAWAPEGWATTKFHHDGKRVADGRLLTIENRPNGLGDRWIQGFAIRLHDPDTGEISFDLRSQDLLDAGELDPGVLVDPWHPNWADWYDGPSGPEVVVSLCNARQILSVDAVSGELNWTLGAGLGWTVRDRDGALLGDEALPQCQHGLEVTGDRVLVYDNAQDRPESSVSEWQIDPVARTATRLWIWTEPGWHEEYLGDVDTLPNGRVLVTCAASLGARDAEIVDVDRATGRVGSRLTFGEGYTYRADRYDGCDLFTSVRDCAALEERYLAVIDRFGD